MLYFISYKFYLISLCFMLYIYIYILWIYWYSIQKIYKSIWFYPFWISSQTKGNQGTREPREPGNQGNQGTGEPGNQGTKGTQGTRERWGCFSKLPTTKQWVRWRWVWGLAIYWNKHKGNQHSLRIVLVLLLFYFFILTNKPGNQGTMGVFQ